MAKVLILLAGMISIFLISCQRELYFPIVPSSGTLKSNTAGDCLPSTIHGVYKEAGATTNDNYIEVTTDIKTTGQFTIVTDTVDGLSFSASGKFEKKGLNTVHMVCNGTPVKGGLNVFTVKYDTSICRMAVNIDSLNNSGGGAPLAIFTLGGSPGTCTTFVLSGTYITDYRLSPSDNTAQLQVDVTKVGDYIISTNTVNGVKFSSNGTFTSTGVQTVTLQGSGAPIAPGSFIYSASGGGTTCSFSVEAKQHGQFSFVGAPGNCFPATVEGIFKIGDTLTMANKVTIRVNVTTIGAYVVSTDEKDGFTFYATGDFTTLGIQDIILQAQHTPPLESGVFTYTAQPNNPTCRFSVVVQ